MAPRVHSANLLLEILLTRARQVTLLIDHPQAIVFLCIITELSQIQGPTGWHTMLLIYRIREFSFQKNNYALVLLTQLIKLMVDVTHTIYMSVLNFWPHSSIGAVAPNQYVGGVVLQLLKLQFTCNEPFLCLSFICSSN